MNTETNSSIFLLADDSAEHSKETKRQLLEKLDGIYRVVTKADVERYLPHLAQEYKNLSPIKRFILAFRLLVSHDLKAPVDLEDDYGDETMAAKLSLKCRSELRIFILDDFPDSIVAEHMDIVDGIIVLTSQIRSNVSEHSQAVVDDCEFSLELSSDTLQEVYTNIQQGGPEWADLTFNRFPISDVSFTDVEHGISELLLDLATEKCNFKRWVSSTRSVKIPYEPLVGDQALQEKGGLHKVYNDVLSRIFEASLGVGMVIYAMSEAVAIQAGEKKMQKYDVGRITERRTIEYHDAIAAKLGLSGALYEAIPGNEHVHPTLIEGQSIGEIEKRMVMHLHFPGVGYVGRRGFPAKPLMSNMEQGIQKTELESFSGFRMTKVGLVQHLIAIEDLLAKHDKTDRWIGSIRKRGYIERLSRNCLSQRLLQVFSEDPEVFKIYDHRTDSLILATHISTAARRQSSFDWSATSGFRSRPTFADWKLQTQCANDDFTTPRTMKAAQSCIELTPGEIKSVVKKSHELYPSDHSIIRIIEPANYPRWISVSMKNCSFGLRPHSSEHIFRASFPDDSQVVVSKGPNCRTKPDGFGTVVATHTHPSGLILSCCTNGTICQQYFKTSKKYVKPATETCRTILPSGTVVVDYADGSQTQLHVSGDVSRKNNKTDDVAVTASVECKTTVDPVTAATIITRADNVVLTLNKDGSKLVLHSDGTSIAVSASHTEVVVRKESFAEVWIDYAVDKTAMRHSQGENVTVAKGGVCTRSCTTAPDGTIIEIDYDTRVVAEINGILRYRRPDGVIIAAYDNAKVEYYPALSSSEKNSGDDPLSGVFVFHCIDRSLTMHDIDHNRFYVQLPETKDGVPRIEVDLSGEVDHTTAKNIGIEPVTAMAVVDNPREPHIFVINGDGTGVEILRPRDVDEYFQISHRLSNIDAIVEELSHSELLYLIDNGRRHLIKHKQTDFFNFGFGSATSATMIPSGINCSASQKMLIRRLYETQLVTDLTEQVVLDDINQLTSWKTGIAATEKNCEMHDPRSADDVQKELFLRNKLILALKAARSKKKLERIKQKEAKGLMNSSMHPVLEEAGENYPEDDSEYFSDSSQEDIDDVGDNMYGLIHTAFDEADVRATGRLSIKEARRALVCALGTGIALDELREILSTMGEDSDQPINYELFSILMGSIRDNQQRSPKRNESKSRPARSASAAVRGGKDV